MMVGRALKEKEKNIEQDVHKKLTFIVKSNAKSILALLHQKNIKPNGIHLESKI